MFLTLWQIADKDATTKITFNPAAKMGGPQLIVFGGEQKGAAIQVKFKSQLSKFVNLLLKQVDILLAHEGEKSIPITMNTYSVEKKQYSVVAVIFLNKNANNIYSLIIKGNNFRHEYIFTMNNEISISGEKLTEEAKSLNAFESFKREIETILPVYRTLQEQYNMLMVIDEEKNKSKDSKPYQKGSYSNNKPSANLLEDDFM